jgi:hypothetical protein
VTTTGCRSVLEHHSFDIAGDAANAHELHLDVLDEFIVDSKLPLERAVRDAPCCSSNAATPFTTSLKLAMASFSKWPTPLVDQCR